MNANDKKSHLDKHAFEKAKLRRSHQKPANSGDEQNVDGEEESSGQKTTGQTGVKTHSKEEDGQKNSKRLDLDELVEGFTDRQKEQIEKLLMFARAGHTLAGPYDNGKGQKLRFMVLNKDDKSIMGGTQDAKISEILNQKWENLGGVIKHLDEQHHNQEKGQSGQSELTVTSMISQQKLQELPVVQNIVGKFGWYMDSMHNLGLACFIKIMQSGLIQEDIWGISLADTDSNRNALKEARGTVTNAVIRTLDMLLRSKEAAQELAKMDYELQLESARLLMVKKELADMKIRADWYENAFKMQQMCMCANDAREFAGRIIAQGYISAAASAQQSTKTQVEESKEIAS